MKSKVVMIFSLALCAAAMCGCLKDRYDESKCPRANSPMLTLTLHIPGLNDAAPDSRSMTQANENEIASVDLLAFGQDGNFAYASRATNVRPGSEVNERLARVQVQISKDGEKYSLVLLANLPDGYIAAMTDEFEGKSKNEVLGQITFSGSPYYSGGKWVAATGSASPIPMWGEHAAVELTTSTVLSRISMTRAVARIDVGLNFKTGFENPAVDYTSDYAAQGLGTTFVITKVRVCNVLTAGYAAPLAGNWAGDPKLPSVAGLSSNLKEYIEYTPADGISLIREIYVAESDICTQTDSKDMTCLLIAGKYNNGAETWYRVDFYDRTDPGDPRTNRLDILRNHRYIVNVTGVKGNGYATDQEALVSDPMNLDSNIIYWNDEGMNPIRIDGQNYLLATPRRFDFTAAAVTDANTNNLMTVATDVDGGWSIDVGSVVYSPALANGENGWLSFSADSGSGDGVKRQVSLLIATANEGSAARTATFHVAAGRMRLPVTVTHKPFIPWGGYDDILVFASDGTLSIGVWARDWDAAAYADGKARGGKNKVQIDATNYYTTMAFFKFGSVVGFTPDGSTWSTNYVKFNPHATIADDGYGTSTAGWGTVPSYTAADYEYDDGGTTKANLRDFLTDTYQSGAMAGQKYHNVTNIRAGKGDPCKLVGKTGAQIRAMSDTDLANYDSGWRLPTKAENGYFADNTKVTTSTSYSKTTYGYWTANGTNKANPATAGFPVVAATKSIN